MVNAAQIAKESSHAVMAPPQGAVSEAKFRASGVMAPPQTAISEAKLRAAAIAAPPQTAASIAKLRVFAVITTKDIIVPDYDWPQNILVPQKAKLIVQPFNTVGGVGFTNVQQVIGNTPGRWQLDLSGVRVKTNAQRLEWEKLEIGLQGQANTVGVPIYRWMQGLVPWPTINGILTTSAPGYNTPVILTYANAQALEGTNTITIRLEQGAAIQAGYYFGINYKVYAIKKVTAQGMSSGSPSYPTYTVTIWPPIRERIEADDQLNFDNPILRCRLADDKQLAVAGGWDKWKRGSPDVSFVEDVTTPSP